MGQIRWSAASGDSSPFAAGPCLILSHPLISRSVPSSCLSGSTRTRIARARRVAVRSWVVRAGSRSPLPWRESARSQEENRRWLENSSAGLKCRLCGKLYPKEALNFCTDDFGPLEVVYDYEAVGRDADPARRSQSRPRTMWRYRELLPLDGEPTVGRHVGGTPLDPGRPAGQGARRLRALHQERRGQPSDALVQGPGRRRGALQGRRARLPDRRLRLDGQPGQQRRGQRRGRRARSLRPDPRRPRAGQGPGRDDLRRQGRSPSRGTTTRSTASARRSPSGSAGDSSTSTSGRSTPRARSRWASRSPRTWAGGRPTTSSPRWPAAA